MNVAIKICLFAAFGYVAFVFFYRGKDPSYLDYFVMVAAVLIAMRLDRKAIEKRRGKKPQ